MQENHKFKILLISPSPPPVGGIQSWTENIICFLKNQDQIRYCYIDTAVKYRGMLEIGYWKRVTSGIKVTIDTIKALKYKIRTCKPNIIHLTSSASLALFKDYLILRIAKKFKVPVVIHWRFGRIPLLAIKKNWEWYLISHIIHKSAYSIVIDNQSFNTLINKGYKNITNIPNPISNELEKIANLQKITERKINIGKIVFVGHVYVNKGVYELVKACLNLPKVKQLKLIGPVMEEVQIELETIAKKRDNGEWLIFTGSKSRKDVLSEIGSAELLALPSYTEGFPNAIIEAMAMACPVVATNVGAIADMLNINGDKPCGICISLKDNEALRKSIDKLLSDKELASEFGKNGLTRVLEHFTLDEIFKDYEAVWKTVAVNAE